MLISVKATQKTRLIFCHLHEQDHHHHRHSLEPQENTKKVRSKLERTSGKIKNSEILIHHLNNPKSQDPIISSSTLSPMSTVAERIASLKPDEKFVSFEFSHQNRFWIQKLVGKIKSYAGLQPFIRYRDMGSRWINK